MRNRFYALGLALLFAFAQAAPAFAGTTPAPADWSAVRALSPGEKIVVRTRDGDRLSGRFDSATDLVLNFTHDGRKVSLTRESVRLVQLNRGTSRTRGTLIGAVIGGAAGLAAAGIVVSKGDIMVAPTVGGLAALGAGVGAGLGASLGKGNKNETVYEAP